MQREEGEAKEGGASRARSGRQGKQTERAKGKERKCVYVCLTLFACFVSIFGLVFFFLCLAFFFAHKVAWHFIFITKVCLLDKHEIKSI